MAEGRESSRRRRWLHVGIVFLVVLVAIQLVPYGWISSNPEVLEEPQWDRETTRGLFFRACGDCHSNETRWPWYSRIAPASWLIRHDVEEGRDKLNVSEWSRGPQKSDEAAQMVREGEMPLWYYLPAHPEARLSDPERSQLLAGLVATFGDQEE